jgi:chromosome segregation ATPase
MDMIVFKEQLDGNHQWIPGTQLPHYPDWHVVAMSEEETYGAFQEEEVVDATDHYNGTRMLQKQRPVRQVMFLIRQTRDEAMEALRLKAADAAEDERKALALVREARKRLPELEKELEKAKADREEYACRANDRYGEANKAKDSLRKLERHLGAVRKEIGDARWREITGGGA